MFCLILIVIKHTIDDIDLDETIHDLDETIHDLDHPCLCHRHLNDTY